MAHYQIFAAMGLAAWFACPRHNEFAARAGPSEVTRFRRCGNPKAAPFFVSPHKGSLVFKKPYVFTSSFRNSQMEPKPFALGLLLESEHQPEPCGASDNIPCDCIRTSSSTTPDLHRAYLAASALWQLANPKLEKEHNPEIGCWEQRQRAEVRAESSI